ncbi:hypothetical protein V2J09_007457, partial [Rumex salicifolius]
TLHLYPIPKSSLFFLKTPPTTTTAPPPSPPTGISMANTLFYSGSSEEHYDHYHQQTNFLESCFMCQKPLGVNRDIFMYMGITAFCSEECRQEQIEIDEAKERNWNLSASMRALRQASPAAVKSFSTTVAAANSAVAGVVRVA